MGAQWGRMGAQWGCSGAAAPMGLCAQARAYACYSAATYAWPSCSRWLSRSPVSRLSRSPVSLFETILCYPTTMSSAPSSETPPAGTASGGELPAFTAEQLVLIDSMIAARLGSRPESRPGGPSSGEPLRTEEIDPLATAASSSGESMFYQVRCCCGPLGRPVNYLYGYGTVQPLLGGGPFVARLRSAGPRWGSGGHGWGAMPDRR